MDLNTIFLSLFGIFVIYVGYSVLNRPSLPEIPKVPGFLISQDTGKSKNIQSMKGDASMYVEKVRRQTIKTIGKTKPYLLKEGRTTIGSKTGVIETYFITGIYPYNTSKKCPVCEPDMFFDGGNEADEFCPISNGKTYDANVIDVIFDGGDQASEFYQINTNVTYDGGDETTLYCS